MIDLGTMNGWKEQPKEYTKHLAECGTEYEGVYCNGQYSPSDPRHKEVRIYRNYNMTRKSLGTCYNQHTCNECGITYRVDSGG